MSKRTITACVLLVVLAALALGVLGCGKGTQADGTTTAPSTTQATPSTTQAEPGTTQPESTTTTSEKAPLDAITLPEDIPGYTDVDPATGLHVTGTPQEVDVTTYRLKVTGKVDKELNLTYEEILGLPKQTATPTLVCPGYFKDTAAWSGASLRTILDMAGVQPNAKSLVMSAADGYATTISLEDALLPQNFLAYELEGETLPALHGFPLRAVFPDRYGSYWVKWLTEIEVR
jgi:DMSO/TMAO reductase YedYZ molybdopterin-dependent catalytic subunit